MDVFSLKALLNDRYESIDDLARGTPHDDLQFISPELAVCQSAGVRIKRTLMSGRRHYAYSINDRLVYRFPVIYQTSDSDVRPCRIDVDTYAGSILMIKNLSFRERIDHARVFANMMFFAESRMAVFSEQQRKAGLTLDPPKTVQVYFSI